MRDLKEVWRRGKIWGSWDFLRQKEKREDQGRIRLVQEKTIGLDLNEADGVGQEGCIGFIGFGE